MLVREVSVAYSPEHYLANKAQYAAKSKAWRQANSVKAAENRRRYYEENKEKELAYSTIYNRKKKIGISEEEYQQLLLNQSNVCAICDKPCTRALAVDHDHTTGKIRGLLCNKCNRGLGYFQDNPALLEQAYFYLKDQK